jgi:hypothetical protein
MCEQRGKDYYCSCMSYIVDLFEEHARAWKPLITNRFGNEWAGAIAEYASQYLEALIPEIPYIGGDKNPLTRHLIRSTTSLALYKAMKVQGVSASEAGKILYDVVMERVNRLPLIQPTTLEKFEETKRQARWSQARRYPGDWVWEFVEGNGIEFDYGYDFIECGTQKLYHVHNADEFLPYYCYLDFVTYRIDGWGFTRTMTLAEGYDKCDFRFKQGGKTKRDWPPPFLEEINPNERN